MYPNTRVFGKLLSKMKCELKCHRTSLRSPVQIQVRPASGVHLVNNTAYAEQCQIWWQNHTAGKGQSCWTPTGGWEDEWAAAHSDTRPWRERFKPCTVSPGLSYLSVLSLEAFRNPQEGFSSDDITSGFTDKIGSVITVHLSYPLLP